MIFIVLFAIFIIFIGLAGSVLRKKIYKKLLSFSLSLNALVVLATIIAHANNNMHLKIFCICFIFATTLALGVAFYICHEAKGQKTR